MCLDVYGAKWRQIISLVILIIQLTQAAYPQLNKRCWKDHQVGEKLKHQYNHNLQILQDNTYVRVAK